MPDHPEPEPQYVPRTSFEPRGARDVYWCWNMNEPTVVRYAPPGGDDPLCGFCGPMDPDRHTFVVHVHKPSACGVVGESVIAVGGPDAARPPDPRYSAWPAASQPPAPPVPLPRGVLWWALVVALGFGSGVVGSFVVNHIPGVSW